MRSRSYEVWTYNNKTWHIIDTFDYIVDAQEAANGLYLSIVSPCQVRKANGEIITCFGCDVLSVDA